MSSSLLDSFIAQQVASYTKPDPPALVKYEKPTKAKAPKAPKVEQPEGEKRGPGRPKKAAPQTAPSAEPKAPSNPFLGLTKGRLATNPEAFLVALRKVQGQQIHEACVLFENEGYSFSENHGFQLESQVRRAKAVLARDKQLVNSLRPNPPINVVAPLAYKGSSADDLAGRLELALDTVNELTQKRDSLSADDPKFAQVLLALRLENERIENIRTQLRRLGVDA